MNAAAPMTVTANVVLINTVTNSPVQNPYDGTGSSSHGTPNAKLIAFLRKRGIDLRPCSETF